MKDDRKTLGRQGEEIAVTYLVQEGYQITSRNYRAAGGEIDIIVEKNSMTIFVEVKTNRSDTFGPPELRVTPHKQRQITKVATRYLQNRGITEGDFRFDVVAITLTGERHDISHIEGAFGV